MYTTIKLTKRPFYLIVEKKPVLESKSKTGKQQIYIFVLMPCHNHSCDRTLIGANSYKELARL